MDNNNQPQDFLSQQHAAPQEQAFRDNNPFEVNGIGFQGAPDFESYQIGQDYNGLAPLDNFSSGVGIGVESEQEGLMRDAMRDVYPNPIEPFPHVVPGYEVSQQDAMRGVTYPAIGVVMGNEKMYFSGLTNEVLSFHEMNAQPELQGYHPMGPANTDE